MDGAVGVRLEGIAKTYAGGEVAALDGVDLAIEPGSFFSILGPSGCGKTTLLRIIAGFEYPSRGRVFIGEQDVTALSPRDRDIAMVFQDYALYPHMSAAQNITFNLRNRRVPRAEIARRLAETAAILGIERLLDKKPAQLSGGERQRVALGRAMIRKPRVFLMDEPLSNLDLKLREQMRIELGRLHQALGVTVIFVTHDQAEAMTLSSALAVMRQGRLQQVGRPDHVYARPVNTFVARFIGSPSMNLLRMVPAEGRLRAVGAPGASLPAPPGLALPAGREVLVGVRPHQLKVAQTSDGEGLPVRVSLTEHLGRNNFVVCHPVPDAGYLYEQDAIQIETDAGVTFPVGTPLRLHADPGALRLFDTDGALIEGQA
ncbi:MAG: ABC transporter ATP-binding protein [Alphaproteobacteria bacterium]